MNLKMFRGESEEVWFRRLVLRGYPEHAARGWAAFLVGKERTPPKWMDMNDVAAD